ncbi:MAG TPA: sigma-70 family RNA polymerase sigma factor [Polyangiaceae bacterium]|nr:sigma-70 family RNA polymerase sigma factor [Polyangiaceae bacterium]
MDNLTPPSRSKAGAELCAPPRAAALVHLSYAQRRLVEAIGRRLGVRDSELQDLVQRVVLTMFRKAELVQTGSERAFLSEVTRREARHILRSGRRHAALCSAQLAELGSAGHCPEEPSSRLDDSRRLQLALAEISAPLLEVWIRHVLDGASCQAVASELGLPLGTVKSRLRRVWARVFEASNEGKSHGNQAQIRMHSMEPSAALRALGECSTSHDEAEGSRFET